MYLGTTYYVGIFSRSDADGEKTNHNLALALLVGLTDIPRPY